MMYLFRTLQAAFVVFTRLPLASGKLQEQHFRHSHYFLPVIGAVVGLGMVLVYRICLLQLSPDTAVFFALLSGILLTGALHEDGFADCCDGFGGGRNREHIIEIMKDARLGSYGVLGLIAITGSKFVLLTEIPYTHHVFALLTTAVAARIIPLLLMAFLPYVQNSPSKMTGAYTIQFIPLCLSMLFVMVFMQSLHPFGFTVYLVAMMALVSLLSRWYLAQRLQGYNGDCLGASEQITECAVLLLLAIYY